MMLSDHRSKAPQPRVQLSFFTKGCSIRVGHTGCTGIHQSRINLVKNLLFSSRCVSFPAEKKCPRERSLRTAKSRGALSFCLTEKRRDFSVSRIKVDETNDCATTPERCQPVKVSKRSRSHWQKRNKIGIVLGGERLNGKIVDVSSRQRESTACCRGSDLGACVREQISVYVRVGFPHSTHTASQDPRQ